MYNNTIARSRIKNSPAPIKAVGGIYSVPYLECSDKYYGETIKSLNSRISQRKYDVSIFKYAMLCTDTCLKKIILLIGKMHHFSSIIKKKSFKWLNPLSAQSCLTLICLLDG